jgi:hypothetical protein
MIKAVVACSWTAVVIVHEIVTTTAPSSASRPTHSERAVARMITTSP